MDSLLGHRQLGRLLKFLLFAWAFSSTAWSAEPIRIFQIDHRYEYPNKLLQLALDKTAQHYGAATVSKLRMSLTNERSRVLINNDVLDVASYAQSPEAESELLPVRIPLLQGLLGYRVFLIHKANKEQFKDLSSLASLRELTLGTGLGWGDNAILEHHDMRLHVSPLYKKLFIQLNRQRFDYFPRGVHELNNELASFKGRYKNVIEEQSKALFYSMPVYFYVAKDNTALHQRLTKGLKLALRDGSMQALFQSAYADVIAKVNSEKRQIFCLDNPLLTQAAQFKTRWWWQGQSAFSCS